MKIVHQPNWCGHGAFFVAFALSSAVLLSMGSSTAHAQSGIACTSQCFQTSTRCTQQCNGDFSCQTQCGNTRQQCLNRCNAQTWDNVQPSQSQGGGSSYDDSYDNSYDDSYDNSYDDSYDNSYGDSYGGTNTDSNSDPYRQMQEFNKKLERENEARRQRIQETLERKQREERQRKERARQAKIRAQQQRRERQRQQAQRERQRREQQQRQRQQQQRREEQKRLEEQRRREELAEQRRQQAERERKKQQEQQRQRQAEAAQRTKWKREYDENIASGGQLFCGSKTDASRRQPVNSMGKVKGIEFWSCITPVSMGSRSVFVAVRNHHTEPQRVQFDIVMPLEGGGTRTEPASLRMRPGQFIGAGNFSGHIDLSTIFSEPPWPSAIKIRNIRVTPTK